MNRGWLEAGTVLYRDKQPNKPFIPRRGESFVSYEVVRAEYHDQCIADLVKAARWASQKMHREYRSAQPDAREGECWAEVQQLDGLLDEYEGIDL